MKKIIFIMIKMLVVGLSQIAPAQKVNNVFNENTVKEMYRADSVSTAINETKKNDVNMKAVRDFVKLYKDIDDVQWYVVEDGFIAQFNNDGIETKVEYDIAGRRRNVLRTYDEAHMTFEIRDMVKSRYYDYNILVVYEIEHRDGITYIIKIMDKTSRKTLQVANNEMKVLEDYVSSKVMPE